MRGLADCVVLTLTAVVLTGGVTYAQEKVGPNFEQLKGFGPMIGTWRYEGPLLEDIPDIAKKGSNFVFQFSWRWILNKNVVEENWMVEYEGGVKASGKAIIGWNAAEKQLAYGGMDSLGGMTLGTITPNYAAKTMPLTAKGIDGDGNETSFQGVVIVKDKDTISWHAAERTGGDVDGPSPVYEFKRVERAGSKKTK